MAEEADRKRGLTYGVDTDFLPGAQGEFRSTSSTGGQKGVKPERYSLIPTEPLAEVARLYGRGAEKYKDHNWRKGYELSKSYDAMQRHGNDFWAGEDVDPETGYSNLAAVVFHAFTMMDLLRTHPEFDDRYVEGKPALDIPMTDEQRDYLLANNRVAQRVMDDNILALIKEDQNKIITSAEVRKNIGLDG